MELEIKRFKTKVNDIFRPDIFKWIIITNKTYANRRL